MKNPKPAPEAPSPSQLVRFADRLHRLPPEQRAHVIARAKARVESGRPRMRDRAWAVLGG